MEMTLSEARTYLLDNANKGVKCPCCNQNAKTYKRKLTSAMAYGLLLLTKSEDIKNGRYIHVENYLKGVDCESSVRGDIPKLRFWGLIEPKEGKKEDGNPSNGYYRVTMNGFLFAKGLLQVQPIARIYNNTLLGLEGEIISIKKALKNKFQFEELMKA